MRIGKPVALFVILVPVLLAACGRVGVTAPSEQAPPLHSSEGLMVVETPRGRAAAELVVQPAEIGPGDRVSLRVANRGALRLGYGRPVMVERWEGQEWVETDDSRQSAWTMELILVEPSQTGVQQTWPFREGDEPGPGWYRFTKQVHVEDTTGEPERFTVRGRVRVVER